MADIRYDRTQTGYFRVTCFSCACSLVRQLWMSDESWQRILAQFLEKHKHQEEQEG